MMTPKILLIVGMAWSVSATVQNTMPCSMKTGNQSCAADYICENSPPPQFVTGTDWGQTDNYMTFTTSVTNHLGVQEAVTATFEDNDGKPHYDRYLIGGSTFNYGQADERGAAYRNLSLIHI